MSSNLKNKPSKGNKKNLIIAVSITSVIVALVWFGGIFLSATSKPDYYEENDFQAAKNFDSLVKSKEKTAPIKYNDTVNVNSELGTDPHIDLSKIEGRVINIAITGVDSRLGDRTKHADANHVVTLLLDSGKVYITSIPRDTYVDLGYDDSTNLNKLTISRASRSQKTYHEELSKIAKVKKIDYWVEFGFSQAMGLIEFLGYSNPNSTLQVLRSRKALGGDDFQRCYNQGQFIRQAVLKNVNKADGLLGDLMIKGSLVLVESNLTSDIAKKLLSDLKKSGFGKSQDDIKVSVRPKMGSKFKVFDFNNQEVVSQLQEKTHNYHFNKERVEDGDNKDIQLHVVNRLKSIIAKAGNDTLKNPKNSIRILQNYFDQRAWLQIKNTADRDRIREDIKQIMVASYIRTKREKEAEKIKSIIELEKEYLNNKLH
jgi:anionic cell wall polymer biosynthesis LytR-Cps2A-Psr (LCP) family protein